MDVHDPHLDEGPVLPLSALEFETLMEPLFGKPAKGLSFGVAVSGGADSLALTLLLHQWIIARGGTLQALTVDHGLRQGSDQEALQVGHWLQAIGISHTVLTAPPWAPKSRIQEKARALRHHLLETYCTLHHLEYLFFGHHLQDQWETFIHRLSHKSGLDGLTCMRPLTRGPFVVKCRPFLDIPKERLIQTLQSFGQPYIEDPSNSDKRFLRSEIRALSGAFKKLGVTPEAISGTIHKLRKVRDCLETLTYEAYDKTTQVSPLGYGCVDLKSLVSFPKEVARRLFESLCLRIFPRPYPPKSTSFDPLLEILYPHPLDVNLEVSPTIPPSIMSLSIQGTLFLKKKDTLWVMRAPSRKKYPPHLMSVSTTPSRLTNDAPEKKANAAAAGIYLWDNRFLIEESTKTRTNEKTNDVSIAPLGKKGLLILKKLNHPLEALPIAAYETLLALWKNTELLSVPNLDFGLEAWKAHRFGANIPRFINNLTVTK